jgi:hypothetical protein
MAMCHEEMTASKAKRSRRVGVSHPLRCCQGPLAYGVPSNFIRTYMYVYQMINVSSLYILAISAKIYLSISAVPLYLSIFYCLKIALKLRLLMFLVF